MALSQATWHDGSMQRRVASTARDSDADSNSQHLLPKLLIKRQSRSHGLPATVHSF